MSQIVLGTESTGLESEEGHGVIEIAGIELLDRGLTGRPLQYCLESGACNGSRCLGDSRDFRFE